MNVEKKRSQIYEWRLWQSIYLYYTFPAGDERCLSRSASAGSEAWAARATKADCIKGKIIRKRKKNNNKKSYGRRAPNQTFLGELKRSAYWVNAVLNVQGAKGGGNELPLNGVPSSLSVWMEKYVSGDIPIKRIASSTTSSKFSQNTPTWSPVSYLMGKKQLNKVNGLSHTTNTSDY